MRFNFNLLLAAALVMLAGCQTSKKDEVQAVIRVHLEVNPAGRGMSRAVPIYRANPAIMNIHNEPIVNEALVEKAELIESGGGFALQIQFNPTGGRLLEQYSATNPGRHFAIFSQFGGEIKESRWLAAPLIGRRITDGKLVFTPDCSRAEAEQIVLGLSNVIAKAKRRDLVK